MRDDALICWHCPGECDNQFDNGIFMHCDDVPDARCLFQHVQHNYAGHGINQVIRGCNTEQTQDFCHFSNGEVSFGYSLLERHFEVSAYCSSDFCNENESCSFGGKLILNKLLRRQFCNRTVAP